MVNAAEIKQLEAKVKENVKQINELPKIVKALKHQDKAIAQAAMLSIRRLMVFFLEKGDLKAMGKDSTSTDQNTSKKAKTESSESDSAILKFRKWLWNIYVNFVNEMLEWVHDATDENVQVAALRTLMEFVSREGELKQQNHAFGNETFMRLMQQIVHAPQLRGQLESVFKGEYVRAYADVQYYMLKNLTKLLEKLDDDEEETDPDQSKRVIANGLRLLDMVVMPDSSSDISSFLVEIKDPESTDNLDEDEVVSDDSDSDSSDDEEEQKPSVGQKRKATTTPKQKKRGLFNVKQHQHVFSTAWIAMLRHRLPTDAYQTILTKMPDEIMPHLVNPLLLSDFLTDSYNIGGVTSLLALNSLFLLIQEYNFDYPDFYTKLYQLLNDPALLTAKQRSRFFQLVELFLSSKHLPAYIIAAFAKRFSRLSLSAEPGAILFIIPMVYNLILRHKECLQLIHRTSTDPATMSAAEQARQRREALACGNEIDAAAKQITTQSMAVALLDGHDPYKNDETDPMQCHALESSLWELASMKHHYNAEVATKAKLFEEKMRSQFLDLEDAYDITYKQLFDKQLKRKEKGKVPLAYQPCTSLFTPDDVFTNAFAL